QPVGAEIELSARRCGGNRDGGVEVAENRVFSVCSLVSFRLLDIQEKSSVLSLLKVIDLANGYSLGNMAADFNIFSVSLDNTEDTADLLDTIQERYVDLDEDDDPDKH
ncbi:putative ATP binding protein, partial [Toxoplasma gondii RUB]